MRLWRAYRVQHLALRAGGGGASVPSRRIFAYDSPPDIRLGRYGLLAHAPHPRSEETQVVTFHPRCKKYFSS